MDNDSQISAPSITEIQDKADSALSCVVEILNARSELRITEDEVQFLLLIEYQQQQERLKRYAVYYQSCPIPDIQNGKIIGIIVGAVLGIFLAPVIGIGVATAALIGAAIGWRLLGGSTKPKGTSIDTATRIVSSPGFDSAPQPPSIGGVVPLLFTNTTTNPFGGLRITGNIINSRIETNRGKQILYQLLALGLGEIKNVDNSKLLVDDKSLASYLSGQIRTDLRLGTSYQSPTTNFVNYVQAITPGNGNSFGVKFRGTIISGSIGGTQCRVSEADYDGFLVGNYYKQGGQIVRLTHKYINDNNYYLVANTNLNSSLNLFEYTKFIYNTNQKASEVHLNLAFEISARNSTTNALVTSAVTFLVYINGVFVGQFYVANKTEGTIRRYIKIQSLGYHKHKIEILPEDVAFVNPTVPLDDTGVLYSANFGGSMFTVEGNFNSRQSLATVQSYIDRAGKTAIASERDNTNRVTSINLITTPANLGHPQVSAYPNVVVNSIAIDASDSLSNAPSYSHLVTGGIIGRNHVAAGKCSVGSGFQPILYTNDSLQDLAIYYILRNVTRQIQSYIASWTGNSITTYENLYWQPGDDFLVFYHDAINYFPDVFVHTRLSRTAGIQGLTLSEKFVDYPSIVAARRFCKAAGYFYDDAIDEVTKWNEWATKESLASLLFPFKAAGNFGLKIEQDVPPVDIFNAARIIPGTFKQYSPSQTKINCVQLTYRANDTESDLSYFKVDRTLSVMTSAAYNNLEALQIEGLDYASITTETQARAVASKFLKSRILQNKVIEFETGINGFGSKEGDLILVQFPLVEVQAETSGFCTEVGALAGGSMNIKISKPPSTTLSNQGYLVNIYHLESGNIQTKKNFVIENNNSITLYGLSEPVKPVREGYNGDIVIITKDNSEKTFRISSVAVDNYKVKITAVKWDAAIHNSSDLFFIS